VSTYLAHVDTYSAFHISTVHMKVCACACGILLIILTLTKECIQKFSKRAHEHVCAYHTLWQQKQQCREENTATSTEVNAPKGEAIAMPVKIEKLVKMFKMHCCALDFDRGIIPTSYGVKKE